MIVSRCCDDLALAAKLNIDDKKFMGLAWRPICVGFLTKFYTAQKSTHLLTNKLTTSCYAMISNRNVNDVFINGNGKQENYVKSILNRIFTGRMLKR